MIKDELEYEVTQEWVEKFKNSIEKMEKDEDARNKDPEGHSLGLGALKYRLEKLQEEIDEYEKLISHDSSTPISLSLDDTYYLPQVLIKARMAAKLSQKELASLAGLTEEQIKSYEENDYQNASYLDFRFVMAALDIKITHCEFLVPLDILRRTPVTKEELLSSNKNINQEPVIKVIASNSNA
jgi:transcriptional regulator with XRE-family HTH domain